MAEYVQYRTEETIPELEEMQRIGLFKPLELRAIVKRRKQMEYKIQRRTKCKEDFVRYIQFEVHLLKLIKLRRKKHRRFEKKTEIEHTITNRADKLFHQVVQRFKDDIKLWLSHIKFCQDVGFTSAVSSTIVRMLAVHSDKPNLWKVAADWEFDNCHSVENARRFLQRGLRFNADSQYLYKEAFHLELKNAQRERELLAEKDEEMKRYSLEIPERKVDLILEGQLAEITYNCGCDLFKDVQFSVDCLAIAAKFDFTQNLQNKIITKLASSHEKDEKFWDLLAKRARRGLPIDPQVLGDEKKPIVELDVKQPTRTQKLLASVAIYKMGIERVNTVVMWSAYVDALVKETTKFPASRSAKLLLKSALKSAHEGGFLQEKYYTCWTLLLRELGQPVKARKVLTAATQSYPLSLDLWRMLLKHHIDAGATERAALVLEQATAKLGVREKGLLPLWMEMIRHFSHVDADRAEELFRKGLALGTDISQGLKPVFLDWLNINKGLAATRTSYESLSRQPILSLPLHEKMIEIELSGRLVDAKVVRRCFDLATHQFGADNCQLWLQYGRFEVTNGDPQKSSNVYSRAIAVLKPELVDDFVAKFTLVRSGADDMDTSS